MKTTIVRTAGVMIVAACLGGENHLAAQSAWLPEPKTWSVTPSYTFETYDDVRVGDRKAKLPSSIDQHTFQVALEYGINERFAADLALGVISVSGATGSDESGLADTRLGVRWMAVDETQSNPSPTISLRAGAIIQGSYNASATGFPNTPGAGASGAEFSVLLGKTLGETGLSAYGEMGFQVFTEDVPADFFGSIGLSYELPHNFDVSIGFTHFQSLSGSDASAPGFNPARSPELKRESNEVYFGLGYQDQGGRHYQVLYARTIDGRNIGERNAFTVSVTFTF